MATRTVTQATDTETRTISYAYDATGAKHENRLPNGDKLQYLGKFVYNNGSLEYILNEEGKLNVAGSSGSYQFFVKDHLGNTRLSINADTKEVAEINHYYPFGMRMAGGTEDPNQKYLYNGKELQDETDWLDYGARMYDPSLGRWMTPDPLAENSITMTPYHYVANNPMIFVDSDGMDWFYYKKEGEDDASWNWQKGSEYNHSYTYTENGEEKTDNITLQGSEYLVEYSVTGTNDEGASVGTINVYKQQDVVASQEGVFTGTNQYSGTNPADKGTYSMALNVRDANGPQNMNADESNPEAAWGMQKIPNNTIIPMRSDPTRGYSINASYGDGRIRLIPSEQVSKNNLLRYGYKDRGLYLHGKKDAHNWTHGCVCDKTGSIFNYLWNNVYKRTPFVIK